MPDYLSATEAARQLGLDSSQVRLLCRRGQIRGAVKAGRDWLVPAPPVYERRRGVGRPVGKTKSD